MRFENEIRLIIGGVVLIAVFVLYRYQLRSKSNALRQFGDDGVVQKLFLNYAPQREKIKFWGLIAAFALLIITWANPQYGVKSDTGKQLSSDVMIALDVSNSMYATDILPSRLERAKNFALELVHELRTERIGTIVFAGHAYLQMPLTSDYSAAALFLKSADPEQVPTQGTAISEAIDIAENTFTPESKRYKVLIIISDGEDHDSDAIKRAEEARKNGLLIFTVGVGTAEGGVIPIHNDGSNDIKRDDDGQPVRTQLNEKMMMDLAAAGSGAYYNLSTARDIVQALKSRIDAVQKREIASGKLGDFDSLYFYFVLAAFAILIWEFLYAFALKDKR